MQHKLPGTTGSNNNEQLVQYQGDSHRIECKAQEPMELESYMTRVFQNVGAIGEYCRGQFDSIVARMTQLQDDGQILEQAVTLLAKRADAISDVSIRNNNTMDFLSQATNQIIWKLNEVEKRSMQGLDQASIIQELKVSKEISEDKIKKLETITEKLNSNLNDASSQIRILMTKNRELEDIIKCINKKNDELEYTSQLQEAKLKDITRIVQDINALPEQIREVKRDQLGLEQDLEKINKTLKKTEEKVKGIGNKQLSKSELNKIEELYVEVNDLKNKSAELQIMVETIDEEALLKRLKKELTDSNQSEISKILENIKNMQEDFNGNKSNNEKLSKLLVEMRKKIDVEMKRIDDLKCNKELEEAKWNKVNDNLARSQNDIENLFQKIKNQTNEIVSLEAKVFDYSFKEFVSSFNERVDNRLVPLKKEMQDLAKVLEKSSSTRDETSAKIVDVVKKMVDNRLDSFTDSIDQKLIHIANAKNVSPQIPSKSIDGKQILYKFNGQVLDNSKLQASIDGQVKIKWCKFAEQCYNMKCKYYHQEELCLNWKVCNSPTCRLRHPKLKKYNEDQWLSRQVRENHYNRQNDFAKQRSFPQKQSNYQDNLKIQMKKQFNEDFVPFNKPMKTTKPTTQNHSFHQPLHICRFGTNCWNRDCTKRHPRETKRDREILDGLGFLGKIHNVYNSENRVDSNFFQRRPPGVYVGAGGKLRFY